MKRLSNRGFAISTILYSLLIMVFLIVALMMGIMASNRHNTKDLVSTIEQELNRYSLTTTEFLASSGDVSQAQEYIVPYGKAGWYKVELWGASGADSSKKGGAGSYTSGIIYLEENACLYFYIGRSGSGVTGGANGGGNGDGTGLGGGGASDVRLVSGAWNDATSLASRIMVAAGGSGGTTANSGQNGGTLEAYRTADTTFGQGASQTTGGTGGSGAGDGKLGIGGNGVSNGSGGGGGYYGGGGGSNASGGGGSSFISGYAGSNASSSLSHYFIAGMMSENANVGNGKARIELISPGNKDNPPVKKNTKLNDVRYIRDCVSGIGTSTAPQWVEIQAISNGKNIAFAAGDSIRDGSLTAVTSKGTYGSEQCQIIDLGSKKSLDEIGVFHVLSDIIDVKERILQGHTLSVSSNGSNYVPLIHYPGESNSSSPIGPSGIHVSAWNPDVTEQLPDGTYYIFSALAPNTSLLTALNSYEDDNEAASKFNRLVALSTITDSNLQKWAITKVGSYYKVVERESNQAMQIVDNQGQSGSNINTSSSYDDLYQWAHWEIIPLGDGTYRFKPRVQPPAHISAQPTYLSTSSNAFGINNGSIILSSYAANYAQRFYIVSAQ